VSSHPGGKGRSGGGSQEEERPATQSICGGGETADPISVEKEKGSYLFWNTSGEEAPAKKKKTWKEVGRTVKRHITKKEMAVIKPRKGEKGKVVLSSKDKGALCKSIRRKDTRASRGGKKTKEWTLPFQVGKKALTKWWPRTRGKKKKKEGSLL